MQVRLSANDEYRSRLREAFLLDTEHAFERGAGSRPLELGELQIAPLWPPKSARLASRNDASLVLRVELAGKRVLLTGDIGISAERGLLAAGADLRADVLMLAHHGSRGSSSPEFLEAVGAEVARLALDKGLRKVRFDRGGRLFHGRVKAVAEAARKGGLEF